MNNINIYPPVRDIRTERLRLRRWEATDAQDLIALAGQPHIEHWLADWREYDKHAHGWIKWVHRNYATNDPLQEFISWAVTLPDTGALIGQIAIGPFDEAGEQEVAVGYFMDARHTGRGYMTEAVCAVAEYAAKAYGLDHLIATVQPENLPSCRVVEKAGFTFIKIIHFQDTDMPEVAAFRYYRLGLGGV